jgi:hypothetical protein
LLTSGAKYAQIIPIATETTTMTVGVVAKSGKRFAADVVGGMLTVSWADVERGIEAYEARKQAA